MASTESILALVSSMRGNRPQSLDDSEVEDVLNISLALAIELCASNDRLDRLERVVAEGLGEPVETFRERRYDGAIAAERQQATDAMLTRVLRILLDPREAVDSRATAL